MTAADVLARAYAEGLAVVPEGDNLRLRGARKPPPDLLADLRTHKAALLVLLSSLAVPLIDPWAPGVARLQGMAPLDGFGPERWGCLQRDCALLNASWGRELRRLGWTAEDVFGAHLQVPSRAYHCMGLGVLLNGGCVTDLTDKDARIMNARGTIQSFIRTSRAETVPIWTIPVLSKS